ncbi:hypothetical protein RRG08_003901 [Elysia crispata]|uniref:Uncharacterized protein n=1 Tax=Elysia crispata TaxID=231223 RepID=A0AAE0YTG4_9GAST|nr:hypothetical protein RRG08_003901 [Elysia crispata]
MPQEVRSPLLDAVWFGDGVSNGRQRGDASNSTSDQLGAGETESCERRSPASSCRETGARASTLVSLLVGGWWAGSVTRDP